MEPYQERLVAERDDLGTKITKLDSFTHTDTFGNLTVGEKVRLLCQFKYMNLYYGILNERVWAMELK